MICMMLKSEEGKEAASMGTTIDHGSVDAVGFEGDGVTRRAWWDVGDEIVPQDDKYPLIHRGVLESFKNGRRQG
jgi:hypothetical protein